MSEDNGINAGVAFLVGAAMTENMFNHIDNANNKRKIKELESQLATKPTTLKAAAGKNEYAKVLYDKNEKIDELNKQINMIKAEDNAKINALASQVSETRELAQAWEERAVVQEAQKDGWKSVIKDFLTSGEITITKDEVQQRFNKYYDVVVETNLAAMRAKWTNR